jgi:hypothetical protein
MNRSLRVFTAVVIAVFGLSCLAFAKAEDPKAAAGKKVINIAFDNGSEGLEAKQAQQRQQLGDFMGLDLVRVFTRYAKSGYEAKLITKKEDFKPAPDEYLLIVKIAEYNPGSKAARMIVGFGAGGVKLKIHYDLSSNGKDPLVANDDSVYSGREWMNAARKLNENTAKAVTANIDGVPEPVKPVKGKGK